MNTIYKLLFTGLLSFSLFTAAAQSGREGEDALAGATPMPATSMPAPEGHHGCPAKGPACQPVEFQSVKICYAPQKDAFLAVDSVECSVHLIKVMDGKIDTAASFKTDDTHKRHDLKNILRPVSVGFMGDYCVVLASAVNDSAYVALLDENLTLVARREFSSPMYAMHIVPGSMTVVGRNPYGYDINIIPVSGCPKDFAETPALSHHYRVAKQAEKIKNSDPIGIGLTAVAVAVVFLALVCISLILQGSGKLMSGMDDKKKGEKKKGGASVAEAAEAAGKEGEIYAAIAAAIHLYNDELHDEEDTVITIQKVEREWTPWNAKFYNMNQYFNNRR